MTEPLSKTAPSVIRSSVEITGMTELPSGMRATRENRKMAASKLLKKVRAPAKKKFPARAQNFRIPEQPGLTGTYASCASSCCTHVIKCCGHQNMLVICCLLLQESSALLLSVCPVVERLLCCLLLQESSALLLSTMGLLPGHMCTATSNTRTDMLHLSFCFPVVKQR